MNRSRTGGPVISLTYDDGLANQLDVAMPALEARGMTGTFYLNTRASWMRERVADWRAAALRGHEIGNHTASHPGWNVNKGGDIPDLSRMSAPDIEAEVVEAARWLDAEIGPDPLRTFAYPYGHRGIGPHADTAPYERVVRAQCAGARYGGGQGPNAWDIDPYHIQAMSLREHTPFEEIQLYCDAVFAQRAWGLLIFHGVGGPWIETPEEKHDAILNYIERRGIEVLSVARARERLAG